MQYGLIGKSLPHSYSAEIHKVIADYDYKLLEIPENELCEFLKKRDFLGINVTIPYKETVIPYLDEISENAKKLSVEYKTKKSNLPWDELTGLRNRIVHDYGNVNLNIVYETLKNDIPELLEQLSEVIAKQ